MVIFNSFMPEMTDIKALTAIVLINTPKTAPMGAVFLWRESCAIQRKSLEIVCTPISSTVDLCCNAAN